MYYPQHSKIFLECLNSLIGKKVAILGHVRPDGDCVGAQVGLCRALNKMGIEAIAVNAHSIPRSLQSFIEDTPFHHTGTGYDLTNHELILVDCADHQRIGDDYVSMGSKPLLNIDHHISNTLYATHNIVIHTAAATCEIIAGMLFDNNLEMDPVMAQALYVGIATDTGQFLFPSTNEIVFEIAAQLVRQGANPGIAGEHLYQKEQFPKLHLLQRFLTTITLELQGRVCVGALSNKDYEEVGVTREVSEGFVDFTRSIEGVDLGVFFEYTGTGDIKASLRAKDAKYRVDLLAAHYAGGGHACAAGFSLSNTPYEAFYKTFLSDVEKHFQQMDLK